jgi:hypothetical protein
MKKSLVLGILGLTVGTVASYGQGNLFLDNYIASNGNPVYESAALGGGLVPGGFTAQLYYDPTAGANIASAINTAEAADLTGAANPTTFSGSLVAATGAGSTAAFVSFDPGYFESSASFNIQPGAATPAQSSYTLLIVAYNGSSYASSTIRGYSQAIYFQDAAPDVAFGGDLGLAFPGGTPLFTVNPVPEPTTMALGALGGLGLLLFRRKQV